MLSPLLFNSFIAAALHVFQKFCEDADIFAELVHLKEQPRKTRTQVLDVLHTSFRLRYATHLRRLHRLATAASSCKIYRMLSSMYAMRLA